MIDGEKVVGVGGGEKWGRWKGKQREDEKK